MTDIVRFEDQYYVRASSALADDRTRVLKYGDTFAVLNRYGDIEPLGSSQFGLFYVESRHLSRFTMTINGRLPLLLSSTIREDNAFLSVDLTNVDSPSGNGEYLSRGLIHIFKLKFLRNGSCHEHIRLLNYGQERTQVSVVIHFAADFADIFEVRGTKREHHGERLQDRVHGETAVLSYKGLDEVVRHTRIGFSPSPRTLTSREASFLISLEPKEEKSIFCEVLCEQDEHSRARVPYHSAFRELQTEFTRVGIGDCRITTSSESFNGWLARSSADLRMLVEGNPEGPYPYAGVPWFSTVFGRDGIITALECLWIAPHLAEVVLTYLAKTQAQTELPAQDAEPGKILHEMRRGEMAATGEVPFARYYGSIDSTPLFILLAGAYLERSGNLAFVEGLWPNIQRALDWIDHYGDADGDGFIEYERRSENGLVQQGWKDSHDSVFHSDGRLAEPPIALCEVQAYVFAAKRAAALIARSLGQAPLATRLEAEAEDIRAKFEESFWSDDLGTYVLALDGAKNQCRVRSSNAGHALFCRIASQQHAESAIASLMTQQLFSGWGVRTIGSSEARYNPMSYHNGSVWPHDNALLAMGFSFYGRQRDACTVLGAIGDASRHMELRRLPELFCGFHKRPEASGPTLYPVACAPQAWAAGSVYLLLQACLGIELSARERRISLHNPALPASLEEVRIDQLRVAGASVDLLFRRLDGNCKVEILRSQGEVQVQEVV